MRRGFGRNHGFLFDGFGSSACLLACVSLT